MKVLLYSYFAPRRRHLSGGAQRLIDTLLTVLAAGPTEVTFVCPSGGDDLVPGHANLRVLDVLYGVDAEVLPEQRHRDEVRLREEADRADVVLTIDRAFPVKTNTPVVLALNNFSYDKESRSAFALGWDAMVVPSPYLERCVDWFFGQRQWQGAAPAIHVIPCPVSLGERAPLSTVARTEFLGRDGAGPFLAFPHRPDPGKGFETALRATIELRSRGLPYTLLVPSYPADEAWPEQRIHLRERRELVADLGAEDAVRFHRWVEVGEMAGFLRASDWSLCLSELPEGFGLGVPESILAGTPVIATPSGAVPGLLPGGHGVSLVDFRDHLAVADRVAAGARPSEVAAGQRYIVDAYDLASIGRQWLDVLAQTAKTTADYRYTAPVAAPPPWVRELASGRQWDDYSRDYVEG